MTKQKKLPKQTPRKGLNKIKLRSE